MQTETAQTSEHGTFEVAVQQIANSHSIVAKHGKGISIPMLGNFDYFEDFLQKNYQYLAHNEGKELRVSIASEWFLDNYYIIQEAMQLIKEAMPASYYHRLPKLTEGKHAGRARIYALAKEFIAANNNEFKAEMIEAFIQDYQEKQRLAMSELWAFPTMLRTVSLENLSWIASGLTTIPIEHAVEPSFATNLPSEQVIGNIITSLRMLDIKDWKAYFEAVSQVESILRQDPAQIYSKMDFETRNRYNNWIEYLAPYDGNEQERIALEAIRLAEASQDDSRTKHVGYYLIDKGQERLEKVIKFSAPPELVLKRWIENHATALYIGSILAFSALLLGLNAYALRAVSLPILALMIFLAIAPTMGLVVSVLNWLISLRRSPRILPKMDYSEELAPDKKTIIVIPAMLSDKEEISSLSHQLEQHYLRNSDPQFLFALLLDFLDAPEKQIRTDEDLIAHARDVIGKLNQRYEQAPFFLFIRERQWNDSEGVWMAWERKRGKLAEFNHLLLEPNAKTSYIIQDGKLSNLENCRYVITLDADTILPKGSAARLVATLAHPLNQPIFNPKTNTIDAGYAILQPRVEIVSKSSSASLFTRIFAPDTTLDLYTRAVSDVYQDLFGEGIYVGKGIYDVAAFEKSLAGRIPENRLLSHDLFESLHARTALVSDVVLLEDYPPHYFVYMGRLHRWMRGDWQLLPWLMPRVPNISGNVGNYFSALDKWKIFDNLRRSLVAPALLGILLASWFIAPATAGFWAGFVVLVMLSPFFLALISQSLNLRPSSNFRFILNKLSLVFLRSMLSLIFLAHEALQTVDAILKTFARMAQKKKLLQWISSAQAARLFGPETAVTAILSRMYPTLILILVSAGLLIARPEAAIVATPFLILWALSLPIASNLSRVIQPVIQVLTEAERRKLRMLARRTWLFFEQYVGPEGHWLPPDHFQESPKPVTVYHTSPTNIGLLFLSILGAYDFGYIDLLGMITRLELSFETLTKLERHRGHFFNWYDTRRLSVLQPLYVSTVDSGNLLGCMIALSHGLHDVYQQKLMRPKAWDGLLDMVDIVIDTIEEISQKNPDLDMSLLSGFLKDLEATIQNAANKKNFLKDLELIRTEKMPTFGQALLDFLQMEQDVLDSKNVRNLRIYIDRMNQHLDNMQRDSHILLAWYRHLANAPKDQLTTFANFQAQLSWERVEALLSEIPSFDEALAVYDLALGELEIIQTHGSTEELSGWLTELAKLLNESKAVVTEFQGKWSKLQEQIDCYRQEMDFSFLYHQDRKVFHIGYNLNSGTLDNSYYDLLASEARIASLIAIASNQVPQEHWMSLGRPLKQVGNAVSLVSWSGTMFEYLMPRLLMRDYPDTLISQSYRIAVEEQMSYARRHKIPWGISESGFYAFDSEFNYQYRAFGVPSLSFKRGMETEQVIAPYASLLALPIRPRDVLENMEELNKQHGLGTYGYYEAIDFTEGRLPLNQSRAVVREYMAHHQGMLFVSLLNYLQGDVMVNRFHADPYIESVEMLLQEQMPDEVHDISSRDMAGALPSANGKTLTINTSPWLPEIVSPIPRVHYLSNGTFGSLISSTGAGYSQWRDLALTRWRADTSLEDWGSWVYLKDGKKFWSIGFQPKPEGSHNVFFHPHQAEFHSQAYEIAAQMSIVVAAEDDVEIRQIRLNNLSEASRQLSMSSFAEVVLAPQMADQRHQAFSKLFVETDYLPDLQALLFTRRPRSDTEAPPYLLHMLISREAVHEIRHETDRRQFLGRYRGVASPQVLAKDAEFMGVAATTLDPIMALAADFELEPHHGVEFAYITLMAETKREAIRLAKKYQSWSAIEQAFVQARFHGEQELYQLNLPSHELEAIQKLLSALLYPQASFRAPAEILAANTKAQAGLWSFGISGDYPILLVQLGDEAELPLVRDLIRAHLYWRQRNIKITLVVINQRDSGYTEELYKQVHRLIVRMESEIWINRHDGIFLLRADFLNDGDRALLAAAARVYLKGSDGKLANQIAMRQSPIIYLPEFIPSVLNSEETPNEALVGPQELAFDNGFGGFDKETSEYLIYKPTPAPWINVIANEALGFTVSEAGGGFTWAENSSENRLTAWRNDPVGDMPSEIVYLRDEETGKVWTSTKLPAGGDEAILVRHGYGYSSFEQNSHGLKQKITMFAAIDAPVKLIRVELENTWERSRRITLSYYAEWVLSTMRDISQQYIIPEFEASSQVLLAHNPYSMDFGNRYIFVSANQDFHGFTTDRTEFLGRLGNYAQPAALRRIGLSDTVKAGLDTCVAIQLHMNLDVGQKDSIYFIIGGGLNREDSLALANRFRDKAQMDSAWKAMRAFWEKTLNRIEIETPDASMNQILPWLLYQTLSCRIWGRSALYQSGGAYGFRDQLQDVMSLMHSHPQLAREQILRAARHQFEEGDVLHWWHPPNARGVRTRFSDDLIWLPYVTAHYVQATGDLSILEAEVPFRKGTALKDGEDERYNQYEQGDENFSIYEHCLRALNKGLTAGKHGLPLMGSGDWNDGMNRVGVEGRGESVWVAWFLCATLKAFIPLCEAKQDTNQMSSYLSELGRLQTALETHAWDGEWYLRAFYDDGSPLGSSKSDECKIDAIAQSWAVISRSAKPERARQAMEASLKHLYKPEDKLMLLFTPPFEKTSKDPGYIKAYPVGVRENGGQYTHAALWTVWALAEMGDGERALEMFQMINPINHSLNAEEAEHYRVEPYVIAADVYRAKPYIGMGGWTWYTGSSGWTYRLITEAILGIHRRGDYLLIQPNIPKEWTRYRISYRFADALYKIDIHNDGGDAELFINGKKQEDLRIPLKPDGEYEVIVKR